MAFELRLHQMTEMLKKILLKCNCMVGLQTYCCFLDCKLFVIAVLFCVSIPNPFMILINPKAVVNHGD